MKTLTIALAGNPNSGKSTLFNALTGAHQHVGNYPGVTVEKKSGTFTFEEHSITVVDLPGIYSLSAYSEEEKVARRFLLEERPDLVVDVVDASNLERHLVLAVQLMEIGIPLVLALNMSDVAASRGIRIFHANLAQALGVPVIPTVGSRGKGLDELKRAIVQTVSEGGAGIRLSYGNDVDAALADLEPLLAADAFCRERFAPRWLALKLIEQDEALTVQAKERLKDASAVFAIVDKLEAHIKATLDDGSENVVADYRYGFVAGVLAQSIKRPAISRQTVSDKIDKVLTHRIVGPLFLLAVLWGMYEFVFAASATPVAWLESAFGWLGEWTNAQLADGPLKSLLTSGIIDGAGGVLGFVPLIMFMFLFIAILEDTGYMARVAFILDRVLRDFGMHGNSVVALIVSGGIAGGCAVPGVMATRTLRDPKERLATILVAPFMNCGAKMPVFALLIAAFFSAHQGTMMFALTLLAWAFALLAARLLRGTVIRGAASPFIMELPPYRLPTLRGLFIHMWERTWQYVKKAGTTIVAVSIVLWALMSFPALSEDRAEAIRQAAKPGTDAETIENEIAQAELANSVAGRIGGALETLTKPLMGFDWRTNIALVGGFAAKEVIVATLGTAYSLGEVDPEEAEPLSAQLAKEPGWSPLSAFALILFVMLYSPCFVTIVVIRRETQSLKWAGFAMLYTTTAAILVATTVYQVGSLLGIGN